MNLSSTQFDKFLKNYPVRKLKKGHTLLFQGEVPRYAYIIKSGIIKTYNITSLGDEQIITLSSKYDIVPEAWLLGDAVVAYYFYEAFNDCELFVIPREVLIKEVEQRPELLQHLLFRFIRLYVGAEVHINALEQSKSSDKIINLLHYLVMKFGEDYGKGLSRIRLRLTHQILADMVGLTRETTAHELSRLRKQKVIDYEGKIYIINRAKLLQLRNEDELANLLQ